MKADLAIAYRIYPGISKTPFFESEDKLRLSEICLRSLKLGLGGLKVKVFALLDGCPPEYEAIFRKYFSPDQLVVLKLEKAGNLATFRKQIELLSAQTEADWVYFAEDDYFYLPGSLQEALEWARSQADADFVTLYDHPDYEDLELHRYPREVRSSERRQWQTVSTTCLTFLTRAETLRQARKQLLTYSQGSPDGSTWLTLTHLGIWNPLKALKYFVKDWLLFSIVFRAWQFGNFRILFGKRYKLWSPQPTLATHMENTGLARGPDWAREIRAQL